MSQPHNNDAEKHPKQDFQVERLAFFSDAVFAIAITLLIIEFKVPHVTKESTLQDVWHQLEELKGNMVALLLSYTLIAGYWVRHHSLYKYLHNYNIQIVVANIMALLPIIFLPFSTAFLAECSANKDTMMLGCQVFFINHIAAGMTIFAVYWLGTVKHAHLSYDVPAEEQLKFYEQTLFTSLIFAALFITSLFTTNMNSILATLTVCVLIRLAGRSLLKRRFRKRVA